jgi:hypothetical protein
MKEIIGEAAVRNSSEMLSTKSVDNSVIIFLQTGSTLGKYWG